MLPRSNIAGLDYVLAEVSAGVLDQLERAGLLAQLGEENVFPETPRVYFATQQAFRAAQGWLALPTAFA